MKSGVRMHLLCGAMALTLCCGASSRSYAESRDPGLDLQDLEYRLEQFKRQEHSLQRALEKGQTEAERLRGRVIARGRAYYRATRGFSGDNFMEHAVRVERIRQGLLADLHRLEKLRAERKGTGRKLALLKERRVPLDLEHSAAGRARDALLSRQEREQAFQMAFSGSMGRSAHTAVYSAGTETDFDVTSFASLRGRMPFPLPGRAEIERVRLPYAEGPGLILHGAVGIPARSVFAGRVAYADEYAEYGKTVILDHGDDYFTVTAGLERIDVKVGDDLPQGSRLGIPQAVGSRAKIYFEIRSKSETLSPGDWLGI